MFDEYCFSYYLVSKEVDDLRHERNELFTCLDELQMSSVLPLIDIQDDEEAAEGDVASCSYLERIRSLAHVFRDQNQLIHKCMMYTFSHLVFLVSL